MQQMHPPRVPHRRVLITPMELSSYATLCASAAWERSPKGSNKVYETSNGIWFSKIVSLLVGEEIRPIVAEHQVIFKQEAAVEQGHVKELGALHSGQLIRPLIAGPELPLHSLEGLEGFEVDVGRAFRAIKEGCRGGVGPAKQAWE
ncbi:hypothetical protein AMTRI_Chr08g165730 [Amborella trichopoda]